MREILGTGENGFIETWHDSTNDLYIGIYASNVIEKISISSIDIAKFQAFLDILGPPSHYHADFVQDIETGILTHFVLSE